VKDASNIKPCATPPSEIKDALSAKPEYNSRRLHARFRDHNAGQGDNYRSAAVCRKAALYSSKPD
jgi:hypothetical protein